MKSLFLKALGLAFGLALSGALVSACGGNDSGDDVTAGSIVDVARRGEFSALVLAAQKAGLADELSAAGADLTVLAPDNGAFGLLASQLGFRTIQAMIEALPAASLEQILSYHVLQGRRTKADILAGGASLATLLNIPLGLVNSNGEARVFDSVSRFAILGPTAPADNGLIHIIDRVLIPPGVLTVLQTVQSNPERFSSLAAAARAPALVTALNGAGPFTLFAPVNDAFKATDVAALLPTLVPNQIDTLLKYHVVAAEVPSSAIVFGTSVNTLANQTFTINAAAAPAVAAIDDTSATDARITAVDIRASNGVVHVIDKVLLPTLPPAAP